MILSMKYSVIIPLKDEADNIADLIEEVEPVMNKLNAPWELLCIDDGSSDATFAVLRQLAAQKPFLKIIAFDANYGQSAAFEAGFKKAKGEWLITLDGDGQNDPADIPSLLALTSQADLVCGFRKKRHDPWQKRIVSRFANFIRSRLCGDHVQDTGCSLKIYRRSCLSNIKMYKGMHRFLPALFIIEGYKVREAAVNHRPRLKGKTKYNFGNRSFNTIADLLAVCWMARRRVRYRISHEMALSGEGHDH